MSPLPPPPPLQGLLEYLPVSQSSLSRVSVSLFNSVVPRGLTKSVFVENQPKNNVAGEMFDRSPPPKKKHKTKQNKNKKSKAKLKIALDMLCWLFSK